MHTDTVRCATPTDIPWAKSQPPTSPCTPLCVYPACTKIRPGHDSILMSSPMNQVVNFGSDRFAKHGRNKRIGNHHGQQVYIVVTIFRLWRCDPDFFCLRDIYEQLLRRQPMSAAQETVGSCGQRLQTVARLFRSSSSSMGSDVQDAGRPCMHNRRCR